MTKRVLYLLGCAAPPVCDLERPVREVQAAGWEVCVGLTPTAAEWLGDGARTLEELTGRPLRVAKRRLGETSPWPPATLSVIAPATLNTVNSIALGLTPTWLTGHGVEAVGKRFPLVVVPCVNASDTTHPQFERSVAVLREAGVRVLHGEADGNAPHPAGEGRPEQFPWHLVLDAVHAA